MRKKERFAFLSVGNSNTKLLEVDGHKQTSQIIPTSKLSKLDFSKYAKIHVISVVPKYNKCFPKAKLLTNQDFGIKNVPGNIGVDRIFGLFSARELYKSENIILVDFGTATTISCMQNNYFLGGQILPGVSMMLESLHKKTAKLPKVNKLEYDSFLETETKKAISSGVANTIVSSIKEVVQRINKEYNSDYLVVMTGGWSLELAERFASVIVNPNLILRGLEILYNKGEENER